MRESSSRLLAFLVLSWLLAGCDAVEQPVANATRFVARMSCSCVFVSGRDLQACIADLPDEAGWLAVDVDHAAHSVTAGALWIEGVAEFSEGRGCRLRD
jgi:hypothetical protein